MNPAPAFDYHKFLVDKWGDPDRLLAFLHGYGHKNFRRAAINQWFRRRSIPSESFALLLTLLKIDRNDTEIETYLR